MAARAAAPLDVLTNLATTAEEHGTKDVAQNPATPPPVTPPRQEELEDRVGDSHEDLRTGKPKSLSWCSWYQRVCRVLGPRFDGEVTGGAEALQQWKAMDGNAREVWKQAYFQFCGDAGPERSQAKVPQGSGYDCLQDRKLLCPVPSERVSTLDAFEKRWKDLQNPSKSVQLSRSKDLIVFVLDVFCKGRQ